jgi:hypothetical protein
VSPAIGPEGAGEARTALKSGARGNGRTSPGGNQATVFGSAPISADRTSAGVGETRGIQGTVVAPGAPVTNDEGARGPERGERAVREEKALHGEGPRDGSGVKHRRKPGPATKPPRG